ncbi:hypothetical protein ACFO1B_40425 [Dactylosporangium siamense]|uniref:Malonyl-CoA:ACP transacylase (MAT) domain-containing protein n=1 Tax=Dactylosporangium siamense TaxID=685454 RepID=A0A919UDP2_9ACTN|nr:hypothetical protein [Dactylosporangium siamense]GIG51669.1 hypothetical protein Dsi01nite_097100 [Dactylosporangium siamense]
MSLAFILGQKNLTYDPTGLIGLYEQHQAVRDAYERAAEWTGLDVGLLLRTVEDDTQRSRTTSVGLAAAMLGITDLLGERGVHPAMVGGISLGAMVAGALSGAVSRQDVIGLLGHTDGDQRPDRAELPEGCVAAVLPLGETYESFYGTRPGIWFGGDFGMHTSGAFRMLLLSGYRDAIDQLATGYPPEYFVFSDETVAVHSPLRYRARDVLARIAADITFTDPVVPMCSSLEPRVLHSADQVRSEFSRNVVEPIRAEYLTGQMRRLGARLGVILGPTLPRDGFEFPFPVVYVDSPDDIDHVVAAVREHDVLLPT